MEGCCVTLGGYDLGLLHVDLEIRILNVLFLVRQVYKFNTQPHFAHSLIRKLSDTFFSWDLMCWYFEGDNRSVSAFNGLFRVMTRDLILVDEEMAIPI